MTAKTILTYDGSFEGFLSCIFIIYEEKLKNRVSIKRSDQAQDSFFDNLENVPTNETNASRVWEGLISKCGTRIGQLVFKAFLSELPTIENTLMVYIQLAFKNPSKVKGNYSHPAVLQVSKIVKSIGREKHRMDAFVRFKLLKDGLYFATVAPDFNVLPLNAKHFKDRYADQRWMIYDVKRGYGIYYNIDTVETVSLSFSETMLNGTDEHLYVATEELQYQELWRSYFNSVTIKSRKNSKLHVQHVPKRYWKYLSEKAPRPKI
ncbi:TIGR03915 family putative DNA repair protein [Flavobacteriaceae bacterium TK19130]|nr:TIGR03915 family putative DNA repair protein [Thermobacterium salinum]